MIPVFTIVAVRSRVPAGALLIARPAPVASVESIVPLLVTTTPVPVLAPLMLTAWLVPAGVVMVPVDVTVTVPAPLTLTLVVRVFDTVVCAKAVPGSATKQAERSRRVRMLRARIEKVMSLPPHRGVFGRIGHRQSPGRW